ncbi:KH domain-containing protein [bacterium]|nr:KH domain-containing protein [bacterium]
MAVEQDQQFIEYVVKNLVDNPDDVQLERTVDDRGVLLKLSVHPDDMGKIIGKAGSTAKAIRTLLRVVGAKTDERLNLKIVDRDGGDGEEPAREQSEDAQSAQAEESPAEQSISEVDTDAIKAKAREGLEDLDMDI